MALNNWPNKLLQPTHTLVMPPAYARVTPSVCVAERGRSARSSLVKFSNFYVMGSLYKSLTTPQFLSGLGAGLFIIGVLLCLFPRFTQKQMSIRKQISMEMRKNGEVLRADASDLLTNAFIVRTPRYGIYFIGFGVLICMFVKLF